MACSPELLRVFYLPYMSTYKQKLRDPRWNEVRKAVLARDNYTCVNCSQDAIKLHVHHSYYDLTLEPWEYDDYSLFTLCENCHEEHHRTDKAMNKILLDAVNKCGFDKYGKLYLAAALEAKSIELREEKNVMGNMDVQAIAFAFFEPGLSLIHERYGNYLRGYIKLNSKESSVMSIYKGIYQKMKDLING